jgi:hypothetical protein
MSLDGVPEAFAMLVRRFTTYRRINHAQSFGHPPHPSPPLLLAPVTL